VPCGNFYDPVTPNQFISQLRQIFNGLAFAIDQHVDVARETISRFHSFNVVDIGDKISLLSFGRKSDGQKGSGQRKLRAVDIDRVAFNNP